MAFVFAEYAGILIALGFTLALLLGGGALFARALRFPGFIEAGLVERAGIALLCGCASLPLTLDVAGRLGATVMAALAAILAFVGAPSLFRSAAWKVANDGPLWAAAAICWVLFGAAFMIDWPTGTGLAHSLIAVDYVKHAAFTWSIAQSGTPPWNPSFFDPGRSSVYYYFFYTITASVSLLAAPFGIEARHAAYAGGLASGFAFTALFYQVWRRSGADAAAGARDPARAFDLSFLAVVAVGGLDIIPALGIALGSDGRVVLRDPGQGWDELVTPLLSSPLWVPQHLAALCAAFVGFMSLARPSGGGDARRIALAALAFASTAGLSVYVAMGAAAIGGVWLILLIAARRLEDAAHLALAGCGALILATPWLATLGSMADGSGASPIAFRPRGPDWIMSFFPAKPALTIARLSFMPIAYALHFGLFGLGSWMFWNRAGRHGLANDLARILAIGACAALLIGSFVRSTIHANDLAWRIMMFAQLAALVWTYSALRAGAFSASAATEASRRALTTLGYATIAYTFVMMRWDVRNGPLEHAVNRDEAAAWSWLDARLPAGAVAQSQPDVELSFSYGLYGKFPAAVSDHHNGRLFGPSRAAVEARIAEIAPIFSNPSMTYDEVREVAARYGVSALVVTALDAVFADPKSWVASAATSYANEHVRVYLLPGSDNKK